MSYRTTMNYRTRSSYYSKDRVTQQQCSYVFLKPKKNIKTSKKYKNDQHLFYTKCFVVYFDCFYILFGLTDVDKTIK